jgi:hypothetical protein
MRKTLVMLCLTLSIPLSANASLIGDVVTCAGSGLLRCAPLGGASDGTTFDATAPVGAGAEFSINNLNEINIFEVDLDADTITISTPVFGPDLSGFGPISFTDLDWLPVPGQIVGLSLVTSGISTSVQGSTDGTSLTIDDLSFGDDFVTIDMSHTNWTPGAFATITLDTIHAPEPASLALLALGVLGVGWRRRTAR